MTDRYLKLTPGYFVLWIILWLIIASKVYLIRETTTAADLYQLLFFGGAMLVIPYLGAWATWRVYGREQRKGELAYLAIIAVIFLGRTIMLYAEAIAAR